MNRTLMIYADILFIVNLFMDCFIIWLTAKLCRRKTKPFLILSAAFFMALLFTALACANGLNAIVRLWAMRFCVMPGVLVAFKPKGVAELFKLSAAAVAASVFMGGVSSAIYFLFAQKGVLRLCADNFSFKLLIFSVCAVYALCKFAEGFLEADLSRRNFFCSLEFYGENGYARVTALIDTGNALTDPISGESVIIAEMSALKKLFDEKTAAVLSDNDAISALAKISDDALRQRLRLIPFKSLGNANGMLLGFRCPKICVTRHNGAQKHMENGIIGIYRGKLSSKGAYNALIGDF